MKVKTTIQRGTRYLCTKIGAAVVAIEQVAVVKGLAMWEVESEIGAGTRRRFIVSQRNLLPLQPA